ncbi:malto-oligosyltrehalose synthase [Neomoorella humiferrea]|uniref:malto-oligosyltrehalose synthase n=1 Tax=Neomoorella humiferrea TaxID=676965 RepID=UPI003D9408B6
MENLRIPVATYRLQFNRDFDFNAARRVVPYLHALGVTDVYASPLLQARKGSLHGYDVTDPGRLNPELGSEEDFATLTAALKGCGMGLLLDVVPNHMAASEENPWWWDVLRFGRASAYATYFDIDWDPVKPALVDKVLIPILGEPLADVLEKHQIKLKLEKEGPVLCYFDRRLPLNPASSRRVLADTAGEPVPDDDSLFWERLWRLYKNKPAVKEYIDARLQQINGSDNDHGIFGFLEEILAEQFYRLAYWRTANEEINYRRFFDVSDLVAVRVEDERVFEALHSKVWELVRRGQVTGLRIDHIDGLYDPQGYLIRLHHVLGKQAASPGFYVVVEKILGDEEEPPEAWKVYGTTGYDFLNALNGIFVDPKGLADLEEFYNEHCDIFDLPGVVYDCKLRVMEKLFAAEIRSLARDLERLAAEHRQGWDLTLSELKEALVHVTAGLEIYRTYIRNFNVSQRDRSYIEGAVAAAARRCTTAARALNFLRRVLLLEEQRQTWLGFVMRWQQFTGPVMAKGYEDTALYVYNPLVSLNEVGSSSRSRYLSVEEFHRFNQRRVEAWPHTLNATSTHDTKRSEDVRARLNVLTEISGPWLEGIKRWHRWNAEKKIDHKGRPVPDNNMELFIYQTLVGAWPLQEDEVPEFIERLKAYLIKAAREAKTWTDWLEPDTVYEEAILNFALSLLNPAQENRFFADFLLFQRTVAYFGAWNSLAQVLLKGASPGVPDFYQGTELWNFSLVDPDNRRPVDFKRRAELLTGLIAEEGEDRKALIRNLINSWWDGRIKLYLTYKVLQFRREHRELFTYGDYVPVAATGTVAGHVCAFARHRGKEWALVIAPRLPVRLAARGGASRGGLPPVGAVLWGEAVWRDTFLVLPEPAPKIWHNILTGEVVEVKSTSQEKHLSLAATLSSFPLAFLAGMLK